MGLCFCNVDLICRSTREAQFQMKEILHRLKKSKAKCVITDDSVAPAVGSVGAECQSLKFKLLVSECHREGWLNS